MAARLPEEVEGGEDGAHQRQDPGAHPTLLKGKGGLAAVGRADAAVFLLLRGKMKEEEEKEEEKAAESFFLFLLPMGRRW